MNRRGISTVIATVLILALTIMLVVVVYSVSRTLVDDKLNEAGSCAEIFNKVSIERYYTCYDSGSEELKIGVSVGDVELSKILIHIGLESNSISKEITINSQEIVGLSEVGGATSNVSLPTKGQAKVYILSGVTSAPKFIRLVPVVKEKQCEVADQIFDVQDCRSLV